MFIIGKKTQCWSSLLALRGLEYIKNSIVGGDFNVVLSNKEKRGGSIIKDPFKESMEDLIADWELVDIKPKIWKYTWTNKRLGPIHITTRLDCFLINNNLLLRNQLISSNIIPSNVLNHRPIMLTFHQVEKFMSHPL
jgi:exonuclease III